MNPLRFIARGAFGRLLVRSSPMLVGFFLAQSVTLTAESPPQVRTTVALEGTMKKVYRAANVIVVSTIDGIDYVYQFTKNVVVHGGKGAGVDALEGLREGSIVVVHYTVDGTDQSAREIDRIGDEGLKVTEGVVTRIEDGRKQITITFDDGTTERLRLTERARSEGARDLDQAASNGTKIVVYYSDEAGHKVAHFFRKAS